ncbi:hypothetical protein [Herbiconiux sp. VKM Ac-2851]|uniref:hypothetical protein n=1 Tax=Herbiconiux sp. VKM Ac-2851 TaxID=2739025 RepID=UPI0015641D81|nr:hypothetical protein [Herbiconiux sp. VKM Ac-2851]NQX37169.1 hypothetical protein [Herbiconiux sp. VKM Ac-2851]
MSMLVHIHDAVYVLNDTTDMDVFRADIEAASRNGGSLVTIHHDHHTTEVLVTPHSHVTIEETTTTAHPINEHPTDDFIDFDNY